MTENEKYIGSKITELKVSKPSIIYLHLASAIAVDIDYTLEFTN